MTKTHRKYTPEERLSLLQESEREGAIQTARKYGMPSSLLSNWKRRYLLKGVAGLQPQYKRIDPQVKELMEENERLKRIITKQAIDIEIKSELLKKTPFQQLLK